MAVKDKPLRETALDPENYDQMFPALSAAAVNHANSMKQASTPSDQTSKGNATQSVAPTKLPERNDEIIGSDATFSARKEVTDVAVANGVEISEEEADHLLSKSFEDLVLLQPTVYKPPPRRATREKASSAIVSSTPNLPSSIQLNKPSQQTIMFPPTPASETVLPLAGEGSSSVDAKPSPETRNAPPQNLPQQFAPEVVITPPPGNTMPFYYPLPLVSYDPMFTYPVIWNSGLAHPTWMWQDPQQGLLPQFPALPMHQQSLPVHSHHQNETNVSLPTSSSSTTQHISHQQPMVIDPVQSQEAIFEGQPGVVTGGVQMAYSHRPSLPGEYLAPQYRSLAPVRANGRPARTRGHRRPRSIGPSKLASSLATTKSNQVGDAGSVQTATSQSDRAKGFNWAYYPDSDDKRSPKQAVSIIETETHKELNGTTAAIHRDGVEDFAPNNSKAPVNAPTAPASLRQVTKSPVIQGQQATLTNNPSEPGKWSQSKRWMSQETKERVAFQKTMLNLHYMRADKSPFVPQTPAELTALKAEVAETARKRLDREIDKILARNQHRKGSGNDDQGGITSPTKLFNGRLFRDSLSPFFAIQNCFNEKAVTNDEEQADWPSLAELKEEGDKRVGNFGRYFPLPRLNLLAPKYVNEDHGNTQTTDGLVRWDKKVIKEQSYHITPSSLDPGEDDEPSFEPEVEDLPFQLQLLMKHIEQEGSKENIFDVN